MSRPDYERLRDNGPDPCWLEVCANVLGLASIVAVFAGGAWTSAGAVGAVSALAMHGIAIWKEA